MRQHRHATAAAQPRARFAPLPGYVWAATGLFLGLLLLHGLAVPLYQAPDEPEHVDAVLLAMRLDGWPLGVAMDQRVLASRQASGFDRLPLAAAAAQPRAQRPSFAELHPGGPSGEVNQLTQHPPLYYGVLAVLAAPLRDASHDTVVATLRLASVAMVLPVPALAYLASRRVSSRREVHVVATLVPLAVPQLTHIGTVVNNDNLLVLLFSVLTVLLLAAVDRPRSLGLALGAGAVAGLAMLTKGFALVTPVWIALAYGLAFRRHRAGVAGPGLAALGVALLVGAWWWVRNLLVHGQLQPLGIPVPDRSGADFVPELAGWAPYFLTNLAQRFWGSMGWYDVDLPRWMVWTATAFLLLAVLLAVVVAVRRRGLPRAHVAVTLFPAATLLLGTAATSWDRYAELASAAGIQGRYLFGGIAGLAVLAGAGLVLPFRGRARAAVLAAGAALGVGLQAVAVARLLRHYWGSGPDDALAGKVAGLVAWSPWPPAVAVLALLVTAAGLAAVVATARRGACGRDALPPAG